MTGEPKKDSWWIRNGNRFPKGSEDEKAGGLFVFERIMPLPKHVREALIYLCFEKEERAQALQNAENKDCLIRPYLGLRRKELDSEQKKVRRGTLRNFPLYFDELAALQMNPSIIASDMALGLAAAHWKCRIDMTDVEFVIGSRRTTKVIKDEVVTPAGNSYKIGGTPKNLKPQAPNNDNKAPDFRNRAIQLWMLDFDKVNECIVSHEKQKTDIQTLVAGTRNNDPYYPKMVPDSLESMRVFEAFTSTYIAASKAILENDLVITAKEYGLSKGVQKATLNRPTELIRKWCAQAKAEMPKGRFEEIVKLGKKEGWLKAK
ncbi:hypothetical protein MMC10_010937 [Thelotrema lepadinum]|nr:hypothetical protein [Thelotrema lepadinum]